MLRFVLASSAILAIASCVSGSVSSPQALIDRAENDMRIRQDIDTYSTYAVAKYAGLTDDPVRSAENFARLLETVKTDPWIAEQAIFSVLRLGEVERAVELAKSLPQSTIEETELPRLTLAVAALADDDTETALGYLNQPWRNTYHAMLGRSLAAWIALDTDPNAALALQEVAGSSDGLFSLMGQTLSAMMMADIGLEDEALSRLDALWSVRARLAIGVETETRLLANRGETELALSRLKDFREDVGRHPALMAVQSEIEAGSVAPPQSLTAQQGTARAIYIATAPQATQGYGDIPAVYFALANYLDPEFYGIQALWAESLDQADRRPDAIKILRSIPKTSAHHTSAQGQLAWALRREGRDDEALAIATETLTRTDNRNIRVQLADLLQSLGRDGEAEDTFSKIIKADAAEGEYDWRIYYARGAARERLGEWPLAENDLKTAMTLNPDSPTIMNYLGYSWVDRGINLDEGLKLIEDALRLDPSNGAITDSLGWAHYKMGNYERAIHYLERATELAPNISEILDHLGDAYWQVGRFKEAGFQWERAMKYAVDDEEREQLRKKLESGLALLSASAAQNTSATYP
jgi:tetratricopeptide (TPR) repeat protein